MFVEMMRNRIVQVLWNILWEYKNEESVLKIRKKKRNPALSSVRPGHLTATEKGKESMRR
jgi:hypothetical protein